MEMLTLNMDLRDFQHEFRTALTGVLGMARLLQYEDDLSSSQRQKVNLVVKSGERLLKFVDNTVMKSVTVENDSIHEKNQCHHHI